MVTTPDSDDGVLVHVRYSPFPVLLGSPDHVVTLDVVHEHCDDQGTRT